MIDWLAMTASPRIVSWAVLALCGCGDAVMQQGSSSGTTGSSATSSGSSGQPTTSAGESTGSSTGEPGTTGTTTGVTTREEPTVGETTSGETTGGPPAPVESPWGIASSAASHWSIDAWAPPIAATGIDWLRGFDTKEPDKRLDTAEAHGMQVAGILYYAKQQPPSFPVDDLAGWEAHITGLLGQTLGRVHHWEVWNEPPNFSADKSPTSYATIVQSAHDAAKAVDPTVQIGLAAQSNNVNFLDQALVAGAAGHYDYVTLHPYELLDLVDDGWEAAFMSIVPTMRKMLAARDPSRADVPIGCTEIGEPVDDEHTPEHQADTVVKAYTLAIAQGVTRIHWFEGRDGDSGPFGLIASDDSLRPSHTAMTTLISQLGKYPRYHGWIVEDGYHGFVFAQDRGAVMVAWSGPDSSIELIFESPVQVIEPMTGATSEASEYALTRSPVLFAGLPAALVAEAEANRALPFPWGGDFTDAPAISYSAADGASGLHPLGAPNIVMIDGGPALDISTRAAQSFTVDPNFLSYTSAPIEVTAVVRRNGAKGAGFNLKYEAVSGWKSTGKWNDVPGSDQWYTLTWQITDDQFVGKWGYHFSFDSDSTQNSQYSVQSVTVKKL